MTWQSEYNIGHDVVDKQHQMLFQYLELLETKKFLDKKEFLKYIEFLINYTEVHFAYEEQLMEKVVYPDIKQHKKEHADITKSIGGLYTRFNSLPLEVCYSLIQETSKEFVEVLVKHISKSDILIKKYI